MANRYRYSLKPALDVALGAGVDNPIHIHVITCDDDEWDIIAKCLNTVHEHQSTLDDKDDLSEDAQQELYDLKALCEDLNMGDDYLPK